MSKQNIFRMAVLAGFIALGGAASANSPDPAARFAEIDANKDGALSKDEMRAHMAARMAEADADNDGFLSREEMMSHRGQRQASRMMERHDANGDGVLDAAELEKAANGRMGKRHERMMERLDTNGDGRLAIDEIGKGRSPDKMFERFDKDGNGSLSQEEFAEMGKQRRGHGRN